MSRTKNSRRPIIVAVGFSVVMAAMLVFAHISGLFPTQADRCESYCKKFGLHGDLAYVYSAGQIAGMRSKGPMECKCKQ